MSKIKTEYHDEINEGLNPVDEVYFQNLKFEEELNEIYHYSDEEINEIIDNIYQLNLKLQQENYKEIIFN